MLRPRLPRGKLWSKGSRRSYFKVPDLPHFRELNHVPHLLTETAYQVSWVHFQTYLLQNLNNSIVGTEWSERSVKDILINHARDPMYAARFNYASTAHNNHFFFDSLDNRKTRPEEMPPKMLQQINKSFGSIETMRLEILKTAQAMFGPGFVWLVKDFENNYSVLATYLGGTPYPLARNRQQETDMNTSNEEQISTVSDALRKSLTEPTVNGVGKFGQHSEPQGRSPGSVALTPILCVNLWQHVYLPDYGIGVARGTGKEEYLANWWEVINWEKAGYRATGGVKGHDYVE